MRRSRRAVVAFLLLATAATAFVFGRQSRRSPAVPPPVVRLESPLPLSDRLDDAPAMSLSPDGRALAYVAWRDGIRRLFVRPVDHTAGDAIGDTDGARHPSFSPDGRSVGFVSGTAVKVMTVEGGAVTQVCDVGNNPALGIAWQDAAHIVVGSPRFGLRRCDLATNAVEQLTEPDAAHGESAHRFPDAIPGAGAILFTIARERLPSSIAALSLQTGQVTVIEADGTNGRYVDTGHLLFGRDGDVWVAPFDSASLRTTASAVRIVERVDASADGGLQLAFSQNGRLFAHVPAGNVGDELVWIDPSNGGVSSLTGVRGPYLHPRVSPDGRLLTAARRMHVNDTAIWIVDLRDGAARPLTGGGVNAQPTWSRDGRWIMFALYDANGWALRRVSTTLPPETQLLLARDESLGSGAEADLQLTTASGAATWRLPRQGPAAWEQQCPAVGDRSPDGRWTAIASNGEIRIEEWDAPRRTVVVARNEATEPRWSANGTEIYFRQPNRLVAAVFDAKLAAITGTRVLFRDVYKTDPCGVADYDRAPDSGRFVMVKPDDGQAPTRLTLHFDGFFEDLRRAAPVAEKR